MKGLHINMLLCFIACSIIHADNTPMGVKNKYAKLRRYDAACASSIFPWYADFADDIVDLLKNVVVSWDTYKIIIGTSIPYVAARMMDEKVQDHFYCRRHRCDINQVPSWCKTLSEVAVAVPISVFGLFALLSTDPELQVTSRIFVIGMPFVIFGKNIVKNIPFEASLRPWRQGFTRCCRASGGFPSGHLAELSFMATLYGFRYGPRAAVPLGLTAAAVAGVFLSSNRHYLSQMVAGVGLGLIFAYAADKVIDHRLMKKFGHNWKCGFDTNDYGKPSLAVSYRF